MLSTSPLKAGTRGLPLYGSRSTRTADQPAQPSIFGGGPYRPNNTTLRPPQRRDVFASLPRSPRANPPSPIPSDAGSIHAVNQYGLDDNELQDVEELSDGEISELEVEYESVASSFISAATTSNAGQQPTFDDADAMDVEPSIEPKVLRTRHEPEPVSVFARRLRPSNRDMSLRDVDYNDGYEDEYEDANHSASVILTSVRAQFRPLHRFVSILMRTIRIILAPLLSSRQYWWVVPAVVAAIASLAGLFYSGAYVIHAIGQILPSWPSWPSSTPMVPVYTAPEAPPVDLSEFSARLMSLESQLAHDSGAHASFEAWIKDAVVSSQDGVEQLKSQLNTELSAISDTIGRISSLLNTNEQWTRDADKIIQEDHKSLARLQQIAAAQSDDLNSLFQALDDLPAASGEEGPNLRQEFTTSLSSLSNRLDGLIEARAKDKSRVDELAEWANESAVSSLLEGMQTQIADVRSSLQGDLKDLYRTVDSRLVNHKGEIEHDLEQRLKPELMSQIDRIASGRREEAVHRHVDKTNFADRNLGAVIDREITSPIYNPLADAPFGYRLLRQVVAAAGLGRYQLHSDENVLLPNVEVGQCWPFKGSQGTLGVVLPTDVDLESVAIYHASQKALMDPSTAPRVVSVFIDVPDTKQRAAIERLVPQPTGPLAGVSPLPATYVKVMSLEYNVFADEPFQVFQLPPHVKEVGLRARRIAFYFEHNWGNEIASCVYRVFAFGAACGPKGSVDELYVTPEAAGTTGWPVGLATDDHGFGQDETVDY